MHGTLVLLIVGACGGPGGASVEADAFDAAAGRATDASALPARPLPPGFRLGAATSAHQVEGGLTNTWALYETLPQFAGRTAMPAGIAADHYNRYEEDLDLAAWMGLDVYRFSVEWSRVEPARGVFDADAIAHYRTVLEAMAARDIMASVTLHHFTDPTWFVDLEGMSPPFSETFCPDGPDGPALCWWPDPEAPEIFAAFCGVIAAEYGDLVDEWWTFTEPAGYWTNSTITGDFPPPLPVDLLTLDQAALEVHALPALRGLLAAHALCYAAIHANDVADADGDGVAARVGITTGAGMAYPADPDDPADIAAAAQAFSLAAWQFSDPLMGNGLDTDLDGAPDEDHPEWAGTLDLYGLQYYASTTVVAFPINELLQGFPCIALDDPVLDGLLAQAGCPGPPTEDLPLGEPPGALYGRQHDPDGLVPFLRLLDQRYPGLPVVITENGFANHDVKRAGALVRHLDACSAAVGEGLPLEGYYHWSLLDNFEWAMGFDVRFGLIAVDFEGDLSRTPTLAAEVYRSIAFAGGITAELWDLYGGTGALPVNTW